MTKIERLKLRFASGMSEGRISEDEWLHEFLPMLEDAERYRWLRECSPYRSDRNMFVEQNIYHGGKFMERNHPDRESLDRAIDAARTPTKEKKE